ncbi:J domain-containing protein [Nocardioides donggukensis]|uniref:J domain-containing protein n=1 Tax=Nocardioides donggukensis TaxID=2774019 RepID=A0A927K6S3_9ACTN|nr:J domain-containing protein [Nocardioides donggukensis]MBD8870200.1 J domain-containing protein [Nocardioides donggukensis]
MESRLEEALRVLGVPADSDRERVINAYRRLARVTHPDVSTDPDAAERFAALDAAYRLVSASSARSPGSEPTSTASRPSLVRVAPASHPSPVRVDPAFFPARSWARPPIVAGPVLVRPARGEPGRGEA